MEKPKEILELERTLNIELIRSHNIQHFNSYSYRNSYVLSETDEIIALNLNHNAISNITFLNKFDNLVRLNLYGNKINEMNGLEELENLSYLDLSFNQIKEIKCLEKLKNISTLNLSFNRITEIKNLEEIKQLSNLNLSKNQINEIKNLEELKQLLNLNLYGNRITEIKNLEELKQLSKLDLSNNQINEIKSLQELKQLSKLDLSNNQINELKNLQELKQLSNLDLSNNQINEIKNLEELKQLSKLDLSNNQINELKNLQELKQLSNLNVYGNRITEIKNLEELKQLSNLDLSNNQINEIKNLEELKQLSNLDLSRNKIKKIEGLKEFKNLLYLDLSYNQVSDVKKIEDLTKLNQIDLSYNSLESLEGIQNLKKAYYINFYQNKITDISPIFPLLKIGRNIFNKESNFSYGIGIGNNPLNDSLLSILNLRYKEERRKTLLDYFENFEKANQPLREAKLMLLGEGYAGKTNLRNFILNEPFNADKSATTGIVVDRHYININETEYRVNIWDFGGQWIQQQVHKFFITNESIYIIVLNGRNQERPEKWLDWIKNYTSDSKAIVVVNKMEENYSYRLEENILRKNYPFIIDFHYISLLEVHEKKEDAIINANRLLRTINEQILLLKNINTPVATNFHELKRELEDNLLKERTHINYDLFEELFHKHQLKGKVDSFLEILNKIGTIRYFESNDRLILNPEWLSGGVYKVLMSKFTSDHFGIFKENDFEIILVKDEEDKFSYKKSDYPFICQMMRDFEIAYVEDDNYFVPSLFKADLPTEFVNDHRFDSPDVHFIFDFHSDYPEILISKFIVKLFNKRYEDLYWKNGIVLIDKDEELQKYVYAYVESVKEEKRIHIKMKGENSRKFFKDIKLNIYELLEKTNYQYQEFIKHTNTGLELNYKDYVDLYKGGERSRKESTTIGLVEINIHEVLGLINSQNDIKRIEYEKTNKINININKVNIGRYGDNYEYGENSHFEKNQFGGKQNKQEN